jgi:hypothetical protein
MSLRLDKIFINPVKQIDLLNLPGEYQYDLNLQNSSLVFHSKTVNKIPSFNFADSDELQKIFMNVCSDGFITKEQATKYMCFNRTSNVELSLHVNTPYKLNTNNTIKLSVVELKDGADITTIYDIPTVSELI